MRDSINQLRATTYPIWTGAFLTPGRTRKGDEHCRTAAGQGYSELFGGWIKLEDITLHAFYFIVFHIIYIYIHPLPQYNHIFIRNLTMITTLYSYCVFTLNNNLILKR